MKYGSWLIRIFTTMEMVDRVSILQVEQTKCVQCAACAAACPVNGITMGDYGPAENANIESCIRCGHCVAICPTAALDNRRAPMENQVNIKREFCWDAEQASQFLRSRRSARNYRTEPVSKEKLLQLLDVARFAPTAGNRQGISFMVISEPEKLHQLTEVTVKWLEEENAVGRGTISKNASGHIRAFYKGEDPIFHQAPHLILATCSRESGDIGRSSAGFVLAYAELFAPAIGLGTCWAGIF
jgi:ferredoxin